MSVNHAHAVQGECSGRTALHIAAEDGHEDEVRFILSSAAKGRYLLDLAEAVNGWTPLFIACIKGHLSIVRLLLEAGAKHGLQDVNGWTEKECAVFRGHLKVAEVLSTYEAKSDKVDESNKPPRKRSVCLKEYSSDAIKSDARTLPCLKPRELGRNGYQTLKDSSSIFLTLGPSNTRSNLAPIILTDPLFSHLVNAYESTRSSLRIRVEGTASSTASCIDLPLKESMINKPIQLAAKDASNARLVFEIVHNSSCSDKDSNVIGTAIAILKDLRQGLAKNRESLIRDHTVPILQKGSMTYIGTVTFNVLVVTPFHPPKLPLKASPGFWKGDGSTTVVGHRGFGANSTGHAHLQIGENTMQSFCSAIALGASCIEFDVQLTKDYVPVIFHDFLVMQTGADVPLQTLSSDQFMHLSRTQAPRSDIVSLAEVRYREKTNLGNGTRLKPRSFSVNAYDDYRSKDMVDRMGFTEEGLRNDIKGNLRGQVIQEPSLNLEQLFTKLPELVPFNLEIKYPMLWEAEDRDIEPYAFEPNIFVDTILSMIFRLCGDRNITLSSFSPEICILLACKQTTFPILFINKAGSVPTGDVRAGSLQGAVEFAKAWDLAGIVMLSDPFVMCPRLLTYAKESGLVVGSYGNLNDEVDCALVSIPDVNQGENRIPSDTN